VRELIASPRGRHSVKPAEIRDRIIELVGDLPRIELFAREKTEGWDIWGNEVQSDIALSPFPRNPLGTGTSKEEEE